MSRFRNRLAKRVMAVILSGAMVMSGVPLSSMTAYASEAPTDTGGGYISKAEEVDDKSTAEEAAVEEKVDEKTTDVSSKEEATVKDEDNASSDKKEDNKDAEDTAKETVVARKADPKDDSEDMKIAEEDDNDEDVKAGVTGEWNFKSGSKYFTEGNFVNITEGQTGEVDGLKIDSTNNGKFTTVGRNDWVQANTGTKITVPVEGASKITTTWSGQETYTIDGHEATRTDICKGENNEAVIVITKGGYLGSIKVEALDKVKVSGDVTLPSGAPSDIKVVFTEKTDRASKFTVEADITDGKYETELCCTGEKYEISLSSNKYNITAPTNTVIDVAINASGITQDITAVAIDTAETVGTVTFPTGKNIPSDLKLTFTENGGSHTVKDVAVTTAEGENKYTVELQADKTYTVTAIGTRIDDYELVSNEVTSSSPNLEFKAKKTYAITITAESFDKKITSLPYDITFINENNKDYTYDFKKTDSIELRNGTYSMNMDVPYPYMFDFTQTLTVNGEAKTLALKFTERMAWDFTNKNDLMLTAVSIEKNKEEDQDYNGLKVNTANNGNISQNEISSKGQVQVNNGTVIKIPVSGKGTIQVVTAGASYTHYTIGKETATEVDATYPYDVTGEEEEGQKYVTLTSTNNQLYIKKIIVTRTAESGENEGSSGVPESSDAPESSSSPESGETEPSKTGPGIERPETFPTEWDFRTPDSPYFGENEIGYEGKIGTLDGLYIDATKGKFSTKRDDWAQVNATVTIKVPVKGACTVTMAWNGSEEYTIDKSPKMTGTGSYICKGTDGWVTIEVTNGGYLGKISVKELDKVKVSGDVTLPSDAPSNMKVIFTEKTDRESKFVIEANIIDGKYETELYCTGEKYAVSLSDESYNVTVPEGAVINAVKTAQGISQPITAVKVNISSVTGDVIFPEGKTIPTDLKLTFTEKVESGTPHLVEDIEVADGKYTAGLKPNTTYTVTARGTGVNDYEVKGPAELDTAATNKDIEFVAKTTYPITLAVTSFDDDAIENSKIKLVFTNVNESGYTYDFTGTDTIALRTGTYSVSAKAGYPYMPIKIATFTIESTAKECALDFEERLEWSFYSGSDLMAAENQITVQGANVGENGIVDLEGLKLDVTNGKFHTSGRGSAAQVNPGTVIKIPLRTKSEVTIEGYDTGSNYKVDGKKNTKQTDTFVCEGTDGYATFEMLDKTAGTSGDYLNKISVKPIKEVIIPDNRKIDVWDFAGKLETDTTKYNNNITPAMWVESGLLQTTGNKGYFIGDSKTAYTHTFGDLLMTYHGQDRLYSSVSELSAISAGNDKYITTYSDGYKTVGAWYCNGVGSATTRNVTIDNVAAGDIIVVYAGKHKADVTYYFEGVGVENTQKEAGPILNGGVPQYQKLTFIAEHTGTYKVYPIGSGSDPKNLYHRIMRIPGTKVSGTIDFKTYNLENYTVKFINQTTKQEFPVTVKEDKSFELSLAPGYTYLAVLSGAPGYGFANEGKTITIPADSTAINNVKLTVETKDMYQLTGKIKGMEAGTNTSKLVMTMIPPQDSNSDEVTLNIDKETLSFDAYLESNLKYTIQLEGADDYVVTEPLSIKSAEDLSQDIVLERKPRYTANGAFIGLEDAKVTALSFTLLNDEGVEDNTYVYPATIANGGYGYVVQLRDGAYIAKATVDKEGYSTQSHVVVNGADVYKDLMFISAEETTSLDRVANLYVGYPGKKNNYSTVTAAIKAAKRMNPTEAERITIHIAPGTYTEQLLITVPYITFTNDEPSKEVKLTWYYGIGYKYYSAKGGYYDEASAFDKYEKAEVKDWGTTVRLNAPGFRAENITFENSFNQRIVEAELEDGVEKTGNYPVRKMGVDVESSAYKERACVMYINDAADKAEFYKCKFISNQDTLGTGKKGTHSYYKDCLFEGTTDYICGDGDCVFDNCELRWAGQSDTAAGGYITAAQGSSNNGYLFWNCKITANPNRKVSAGAFGRPWGAAAKVIFVNTELERADLISDKGWTSMSNNQPENANFKEYGTTFNGQPVDTSKRVSGTVATTNPVPDMTVFFEGWTPLYYNYDETKVVREPVSSEKRSDVETGTEITLSCDTADAKIYYTTNGEDPTGKDSELYAGKFSLGNEEKTVIVKAVAKVGDVSSNVAVFEYNVKSPTNLIAAPTASIEPGMVEAGTPVLLNCATNGATIYFTIDGSEPKVDNDLLYRNQPILIYDTKTIKAIAVKDSNVSEVVSFEYKVKPTITAEPGDGTEFASTGGTVTLKPSTGATIYYTTSATQNDLTDPADKKNEKRVEYTGTPIPITEETYLWAVAVSGDLTSDALKCHYTVLEEGAVVKPTADPDGSEPVASGTVVTLTVTDDTVEHIYYTTDGSDPIASDTRKTYNPVAGIEITEDVTIKAVAKKGDKYSEVVSFTYTVIKEVPKIAKPTADPDGSKPVESGTVVTLMVTDETIEHIYYTIDGSDPTVESEARKTYDKAVGIVITEDVTIKAVAQKGDQYSEVVSFTYTIENDDNPKNPPVDPDDPGENMSAIQITGLKASYDYTGAKIIPDIKVWDCDIKGGDRRLLTESVDYTVAYKNNVKVTDSAEVIVTGKGNYVGKDVTEKFQIKEVEDVKTPINVKGAKIDKIDDLTYTGSAQYPNFILTQKGGSPVTYKYVNGKYAREGGKDMDINVAVSGNINKGTATILVTGEKDAKGKPTSIKKTFKILAVDLTANASKVTVDKPADVEYAVSGAVPASVTVKYDGTTLKQGKDYTVKYANNKKIGKGNITITGKGNYAKKYPTLVEYTINPLDLSGLKVDAVTACEGAKAGKVKATVVDKNGTALKASQYTVKVYKAAEGDAVYDATEPLTKETTIYVSAEAKDTVNLKEGKATPRAAFKVGKDISKAKFTVKKTAVKSYTGEAVTLSNDDLEVTLKGELNLEMGTDYEVAAYTNNINKGTATAVIRGIGKYSGTKTIKFKITQKTMVKGTKTT